MEPIKNHYLDIPEERKLRIFREEDERFYSFWEKMLDDKQSFYQKSYKVKNIFIFLKKSLI